jgi:hydroxyacylglutathione hydrolase
MAAETHLFLCLKDNYGVLLHDTETGHTAAIDAPDAAPVEAALKQKGWRLTDILVTHYHADHTQGIPALKEHHGCRVVGPRAEAKRIPFIDETVVEGDTVMVGDLMVRVIETPGHTDGHISYWVRSAKLAFVGDTLFSIGCGRILDGNQEKMWNSLLKLRELPDDALVFCGHEYTQANVRFAWTIEKGNKALAQRDLEVDRQIAARHPTIPMVMGVEKAANPFLRADVPSVAKAVGLPDAPAWQVFAELRARKDKF